ncbi:adipocyte plasma membrane-associated protein [Neodiprion lecontei]|uniref:Adipocyte plasma membrane-associated protein n=1 Tax=Neodiprion lecontei TaxID=441921 RepID=A0A6J0BWA5_NEOLC|nr:adipocyte plasma membrane-associated protein [Neodiprion lecontei]XP_015518730.2 adipocyte plasma membrane-associated protein [Neodiprion lecontei]
MGYLKSIGTTFIYIGLFLALITFLPGLPPDAQFAEYNISPPQQFLTDALKLNNRLDDAEILFEGKLKGPESFTSRNGELFTTLHGGDIVKIIGHHIVPIAKFGRPCDGVWMEKECGRPLGLQFDKNGILYVADPYNGIFKVDVMTGEYDMIVDISKPIEGKLPLLANSLDIAANGDIYWTDSSQDFILQDGVYTCLANPAGRLIKYDSSTERNTVLVANLGFANGVKLSKDESFVVVAETMTSRLSKFHLKGDKAGTAEIFIQGLPGLPDNIHTDGGDGFLVSLIVTADADHPILVQSLAPHPYIRKMLARILYLLEAPFKLVEDAYPNCYTKRAVHWIGHFESVKFLQHESVVVLRIGFDGKITDVLYTSDGKISGISSAYILKDYLYLGSPYNEYLARVPLKRAFPAMKSELNNVADNVVERQDAKTPPKSIGDSKLTGSAAAPVASGTPKPKPAPSRRKPTQVPTQQQVNVNPPTQQQKPVTVSPTNQQQQAVTTDTPTRQQQPISTVSPPRQQQPVTVTPTKRQEQQQQQKATSNPTSAGKEMRPESVKVVPAPQPAQPSPNVSKVSVEGGSENRERVKPGTAQNPNVGQQARVRPTPQPAFTKQSTTHPHQGATENPSNAQKQSPQPAPVTGRNN